MTQFSYARGPKPKPRTELNALSSKFEVNPNQIRVDLDGAAFAPVCSGGALKRKLEYTEQRASTALFTPGIALQVLVYTSLRLC